MEAMRHAQHRHAMHAGSVVPNAMEAAWSNDAAATSQQPASMSHANGMDGAWAQSNGGGSSGHNQHMEGAWQGGGRAGNGAHMEAAWEGRGADAAASETQVRGHRSLCCDSLCFVLGAGCNPILAVLCRHNDAVPMLGMSSTSVVARRKDCRLYKCLGRAICSSHYKRNQCVAHRSLKVSAITLVAAFRALTACYCRRLAKRGVVSTAHLPWAAQAPWERHGRMVPGLVSL